MERRELTCAVCFVTLWVVLIGARGGGGVGACVGGGGAFDLLVVFV